jgi:hypothetical protein
MRVAENVAEGHDRTTSSVRLVETLRNRIADGSVVGSIDPQVLTLMPAISTLWNFVPLGSRSHASNDEILRRFLILRKLEGGTISDVHADFNATYPTNRMDRRLSYVLFQNQLDGAELHARIDEIWPELNLAHDLSVRRLDVLANEGHAPTVARIDGSAACGSLPYRKVEHLSIAVKKTAMIFFLLGTQCHANFSQWISRSSGPCSVPAWIQFLFYRR